MRACVRVAANVWTVNTNHKINDDGSIEPIFFKPIERPRHRAAAIPQHCQCQLMWCGECYLARESIQSNNNCAEARFFRLISAAKRLVDRTIWFPNKQTDIIIEIKNQVNVPTAVERQSSSVLIVWFRWLPRCRRLCLDETYSFFLGFFLIKLRRPNRIRSIALMCAVKVNSNRPSISVKFIPPNKYRNWYRQSYIYEHIVHLVRDPEFDDRRVNALTVEMASFQKMFWTRNCVCK